VAGRRALDLGCGSGVVAIAAAMSGAAQVSAVDVDPHAVAATRLNAQANGVTLESRRGDLPREGAPDVDVILGGDVFYDGALARRMLPFLRRCRGGGVEVLIGDPGRRPLPRAALEPIAEYAVADFGSGGRAVAGAVYRLMAG
jgi:predicted nicotinamide N-methyase